MHHPLPPAPGVRRRAPLTHALLYALLAGGAAASSAQGWKDDAPAWQEDAVTAAPAFDTARLVRFQLSTASELVYGIDPATLTVGQDGVIRYVMVARSPSGAVNALYDGLRCKTAEVKTYARWTPGADAQGGSWRPVEGAEWRSIYHHHGSRAALVLARGGLCDGPTPNAPVSRMLRDLRQGGTDR